MSNQPAKQQPPPRMSSQMEAVVRLMTGKEERTIADKLADPNRPTWEQYKKDNQDKLNLSGAGQKEMEAYRRELDAERDSRLARGTNRDTAASNKKKKKRSKRKHDPPDSSDGGNSSSSSSDSEGDRKRRRKHKKSKKRKKKHKRKHEASDESDGSDSSSEDRRRKKKKPKKSTKKDEKEVEDNRYRLSDFFTENAKTPPKSFAEAFTVAPSGRAATLLAADRRAFLDASVAAGAALLIGQPAFADDDLEMPSEEEQQKIDMEERLRKKAELQKKATRPKSFAESMSAELEKQKALEKTQQERRNAMCEELGRGC